MPKVKHGKYELMPQDCDLQEDTVESFSITGRPSFGYVTRQLTAAKQKAVEMINTAIGAKLEGGKVSLSDFQPTKEAMDYQIGKYIPVEWKVEWPGSGKGERAGTWTILIDMDDIPEGAGAHGPDRPHVGYSYWFKAVNSAFNVTRVNGHIFINVVPASRNDVTERAIV
jgi:hypothetical protein